VVGNALLQLVGVTVGEMLALAAGSTNASGSAAAPATSASRLKRCFTWGYLPVDD
jgi:hypothetical protein